MQSDAFVLVICDKCGVSEEISLDGTIDGGWAPVELDDAGWISVNGEDFCSGDCAYGEMSELVELIEESQCAQSHS